MASSVTLRKIQRNQRLHRVRIFFIGFLMAGIIAAGTIVAMNSAFRITATRMVDSADSADAEDIAAATEKFIREETAFLRQNLVFFPIAKLRESLLQQFSHIRRVQITRVWSEHSLDITLENRTAWALWCSAGSDNCVYVEPDGIAFAPALKLSGNLFLRVDDARGMPLPIGKPLMDGETLNSLDLFMQNAGGRMISFRRIEITPEAALWLTTESGWRAIVDSGTNFVLAAENLATLLSGPLANNQSQLDYIDLRFAEKAFYKLR